MTHIDSRWLFAGLMTLVALERLVELVISRRNTERALRRGGLEFGREHYAAMVLLHSAFLVAGPLEVWILGRPLVPVLAGAMLAVAAVAMALRYWVIATLGERWSTRVVCVPGEAVVRRGPFRLLRHPNYLAVVLEMMALPLVHTAWLTALVFSVANGMLLRRRIRVEESALRQHCAYEAQFGELAT